MTTADLDPLIHAPARLRIVATLAALPEGDTLSFTRLQDLIGLTPGNLITHLRRLESAGYVETAKSGDGPASRTAVALTPHGRSALKSYNRSAPHPARRTLSRSTTIQFMRRVLDLGLIVGFLAVDFLFFHDIFKAGEVTTVPQYMTGFLSIAVFAVCSQSLLRAYR